jgi:RNA polymerase sigma factor (sigma-70 family)
MKVVKKCLSKAMELQRPPNWSPADWHIELEAEAWVALWQAMHECPNASETLLCRKVMAALTKRWRDEWNYVFRHISPPSPEEGEMSETKNFPEKSDDWEALMRKLEIRDALGRLSPIDRTVVEGVIMNRKSLREVGRELGISATAVLKHLRSALHQLREWLK